MLEVVANLKTFGVLWFIDFCQSLTRLELILKTLVIDDAVAFVEEVQIFCYFRVFHTKSYIHEWTKKFRY